MDLNDSYVSALEHILANRLPPELVAQRILEIRTHLAMDLHDRVQSGMDPEEAARAARRALGSPQLLARQMIRQYRGFDIAPAWRLTWSCGIDLILALVIPFYVLARSGVPDPAILMAIDWLPFVVLVFFGYLVVRTQRWLTWPMVGWAALASIGVCLVSLAPPAVEMRSDPGARQALIESLQSVGKEEQLVRDWKNGRSPIDQAPVAEQEISEDYHVPMIPVGVPVVTSTEYMLTAQPPAKARQLWRENGVAYAADVKERLANLRSELSQFDQPPTSGPVHWLLLTKLVLLSTALQAAIFASVNGLLLLVGITIARRRARRDPYLA